MSLILALAMTLNLATSTPAGAQGVTPAKKPNFVVIMIDDAAWSDLGPYGGEARTPHIDALARQGTLFTRYHTSPLCSPSRAMLLTGLSNHQAGVATIPEVLPPEHVGKPGYRLRLEAGAVTVAQRLKAVGYRTLMSGKWHLGDRPQDLPNAHGFDLSLALDASGADNWDDKSYMPYYDQAPWYENGQPTIYPSGRYSSTVIVDKMIDYLDRSDPTKPFLAYVAFQAVHIPVQAPKAFSDRYKGRFDGGWEALAKSRLQRAKDQGLVPANASSAAFHPTMRRWDALTPTEQKLQSRAMEVYAGMIEAMDHEIGRLRDHLAKAGQLDNTVWIVTSDNGPEPTDPSAQRGFGTWAFLHGYRHRLQDLGERGSHNWIGPEWASAVATPGHLFKFYTGEGGLRAPLIVAGPRVKSGLRTGASAFVTDITPTLLDWAQAGSPPEGAKPMIGRSLLPLLSGQADRIYADTDGFGVEVSGNSAFFQGDYKLVRVQPPYGDASWRLYDIVTDPGETRDLASSQQDRFLAMEKAYQAYAKANGVLDLPEGYQVQRQVARNAWKRQLQLYGWKIALMVAVVIALGFVMVRRRTQRNAKAQIRGET